MRPTVLHALGLSVFTSAAGVGAERALPQVSAHVSDAKRHDLSPLLYSIFFETEINYGSEGGLYAELLPNRDFERLGRGTAPPPVNNSAVTSSGRAAPGPLDRGVPPPKPADFTPWSALPGTTATTDPTIHPFATNPVSLKLVTGAGGGGITNPGYWGINARATMTYHLTFYAMLSSPKPAFASFALVCGDGRVATAPSSGPPIEHSSSWAPYSHTLTATTSCDDARFVFHVQGAATLHVDGFSLTQAARLLPGIWVAFFQECQQQSCGQAGRRRGRALPQGHL